MLLKLLRRVGMYQEDDEVGDEAIIIYRKPDKDLCRIYRVPKGV